MEVFNLKGEVRGAFDLFAIKVYCWCFWGCNESIARGYISYLIKSRLSTMSYLDW